MMKNKRRKRREKLYRKIHFWITIGGCQEQQFIASNNNAHERCRMVMNTSAWAPTIACSWAYNKVAHSHNWICLHHRRHQHRCYDEELHTRRTSLHTSYAHCRAVLFSSHLVSVGMCMLVFNFDTPCACYNYNYHYKRALNGEVFECKRVSVLCVRVTMIMWRVDTAKTHTFRTFERIKMNESEKKFLQIVKWENE